MRLTLLLSLLACLALAGCGGLRRSPAWEVVLSARIDSHGDADYAEQLSGVLRDAGIEHKVVTYEFRYRTRLRDEAIETRTSLLYRDSGSTRHPWWLVDAHTNNPVWLPGENLDRQLEFHLHRPATVVSVDGVPASSEGKRHTAEPQADQPSLLARLWPVRKTERSRKVIAPATRAASPTSHQLASFRARHGTRFDPASVIDRVKMERIARGSRDIASR